MPTTFFVLPTHVLTGESEWTQENLNLLKLLDSHLDLRYAKYKLQDFYVGMENAISQHHYSALLTLLWLAGILTEARGEDLSADKNPFEPPAELFRHVVRQDIRDFATTSDGCSRLGDRREEVKTSVRLFMLLLRTHAESMPRNNPEIEA